MPSQYTFPCSALTMAITFEAPVGVSQLIGFRGPMPFGLVSFSTPSRRAIAFTRACGWQRYAESSFKKKTSFFAPRPLSAQSVGSQSPFRRAILPSMPTGEELATLVKDEKAKEERLERMAQMEDRIYQRANGVLEAALSFHEVAPDAQLPPADWVSEYGAEGARQRLEVAKAGWLPQSEAPNAFKLAAQVTAGISRGRAFRGQRVVQNQLNVKISLPAPTSREHPGLEQYPSKEIE